MEAGFFLGRFSGEWETLQETYYVTRPEYHPKKSRKGDRWQSAVIRKVWDSWYKLWDQRNQDVHGADEKHHALIERREATRKLNELYALRHYYEPSARDLLMKDVRDHEIKSTWHIRNWIATNEPILLASYRRVKKRALSGIRSILQYFPRA